MEALSSSTFTERSSSLLAASSIAAWEVARCVMMGLAEQIARAAKRRAEGSFMMIAAKVRLVICKEKDWLMCLGFSLELSLACWSSRMPDQMVTKRG